MKPKPGTSDFVVPCRCLHLSSPPNSAHRQELWVHAPRVRPPTTSQTTFHMAACRNFPERESDHTSCCLEPFTASRSSRVETNDFSCGPPVDLRRSEPRQHLRLCCLHRVSPSLGHLPAPLSPRCLGSQRNSVCLTHTIKRQGLSS